jgi:hypothetical protein
MAQDCKRKTLLRRVYVDLVGFGLGSVRAFYGILFANSGKISDYGYLTYGEIGSSQLQYLQTLFGSAKVAFSLP